VSQTLADRYRLDEPLATGGMGTVYRAFDQRIGRPVAVKVLRRSLASDPTFVERFRREARAAGALSHAGIAKVFDYGERGGEPFIVMELVEGQNLAQRIADRGRLPWREAFGIGAQVARALAAAHALGLVHRDIKPANILLSPDGFAKLTDFGIARAAQATTLTRTGMVLGSANYVAPEQARGITVGPAADLYSLGCVLFEAVCGQPPYRGANAVVIAAQHVDAPVPNPRDHVPDLPGHVAALLVRALAKDPAQRFPSAAAMATALSAASSETVGDATAPLAASRSPTRLPPATGTGVPGDTAPLPWPLPPSDLETGPAARRRRWRDHRWGWFRLRVRLTPWHRRGHSWER
jgi:serine/threonine-protein kinase